MSTITNIPAPVFTNQNGQQVPVQQVLQGYLNGSLRPVYGFSNGYGGMPLAAPLANYNTYVPMGVPLVSYSNPIGYNPNYYNGGGFGAYGGTYNPGFSPFIPPQMPLTTNMLGGFGGYGPVNPYNNIANPYMRGVNPYGYTNPIYPQTYNNLNGVAAAIANTVRPQSRSRRGGQQLTPPSFPPSASEGAAASVPGVTAPPFSDAPGQPQGLRSVPVSSDPARDDAANYLKYAFEHPESKVAKELGVQKQGLHPYQQAEATAIVGKAASEGEPGFFTRIMNHIATFIECLVGQFTGKCGFGDYARLNAERNALHTASHIHAELNTERNNARYDLLAEPVSGVRRDENMNYVPIRDKQGKPTGMFARLADKYTDKDMVIRHDEQDLGLRASDGQVQRMRQILAEETAKLYADPAVIREVATYRAEREEKLRPDEESVRFTNYFTPRVETIVNRIASDPQIQSLGQYDYQKHREEVTKEVRSHLIANHKAMFAQSAETSPSGQLVPSSTPVIPPQGKSAPALPPG